MQAGGIAFQDQHEFYEIAREVMSSPVPMDAMRARRKPDAPAATEHDEVAGLGVLAAMDEVYKAECAIMAKRFMAFAVTESGARHADLLAQAEWWSHGGPLSDEPEPGI